MNRRKALLIVIIGEVFYSFYLPVWFAFMGLSAMIFDDGHSAKSIVYDLYYFFLCYPVGLILSILFTWIFFYKAKTRFMYLAHAVPLIWFIPFLFFIIVGLIKA